MKKGDDEMRYPPEVYSVREDVTRENMRIYDQRQRLIEAKCLELRPDYYSLGLRERYEVRQRAKNLV